MINIIEPIQVSIYLTEIFWWDSISHDFAQAHSSHFSLGFRFSNSTASSHISEKKIVSLNHLSTICWIIAESLTLTLPNNYQGDKMICSERSSSAADVNWEIFLLLTGIKKRLGGHEIIGEVVTLGERRPLFTIRTLLFCNGVCFIKC